MEITFYLLLLIGNLGAFDVLYFHTFHCKLHERPESQREVMWHTARHAVYAMQFLIVANLRFHGAALFGLALIYLADVFIAWADVWEETKSRKSQGGLPRGEYFMHIVLSVLVGVYITSLAHAVWADRLLPTAIVVDPPAVPGILRLMMSVMGATAIGFFFHDLYRWVRFRQRAASAPVHVAAAA